MGRNNRARRKEKARQRQHGRHDQGHRASGGHRWPGDEPPLFSEAERVEMLWAGIGVAALRGEPFDSLVQNLRNFAAPRVDAEWERMMVLQLRNVWAGGWQPAELVRQAGRSTSTRLAAGLVGAAVAADHLGNDAEALDQRWVAQVEAAHLPLVTSRRGWSADLLSEANTRADQLDAMAQALTCLSLPVLDVLIPPPGAAPGATWPPGGGWSASDGDPDPVIGKVRNLLAKAESTEFDAEAIAFTAKAHELMTRHAIDAAALGGRHRGAGDEPVAARVFVDAPYADGKSLLLQIVAAETRCRSVFHAGLDMSTIVGFEDDVAAVQLLFTSLLVQAQASLNAAARSAPPGTRTRSQSFRSAFYLAYAQRIGERLEESQRATTEAAAAELGKSFLPVLASRERDVDDVFEERFGSLVGSRVRGGYDTAGWASGTLAADQAQLHFAELDDT